MPKSIFGTVVRAAEDTLDGRVEIRSADNQLHKIPAHHARRSFQVGDRVEYHITTAGGLPTRAELRPAPLPEATGLGKGEHAPKYQVVSIPVRVREIPGATNDDSFVVEDDRGTCWSVSIHLADGYFKQGMRALLVVEHKDSQVRVSGLRSESGQRKRFYRNPGRVRRRGRHTEVWSGYRWMSLQEALDEGFVGLEDVGRLVNRVRVGGGAYGGPGEYAIEVFLWRVPEGYLLDVREDGEGIEFFSLKREAMERVEEIRSTFGKEGQC